MVHPGPVPSFIGPSKRKKKSRDDDDDDDQDDVQELSNMDDDGQLLLPLDATRTRGTVLITLRNVVPYTQWRVLVISISLSMLTAR